MVILSNSDNPNIECNHVDVTAEAINANYFSFKPMQYGYAFTDSSKLKIDNDGLSAELKLLSNSWAKPKPTYQILGGCTLQSVPQIRISTTTITSTVRTTTFMLYNFLLVMLFLVAISPQNLNLMLLLYWIILYTNGKELKKGHAQKINQFYFSYSNEYY